jgi:hypothetical protein
LRRHLAADHEQEEPMPFPGRKELAAADSYAGVARGEQITPDISRHGVVDAGNVAWHELVAEAGRSWPEASAEDFEKIGNRLYRDRGGGLEFKATSGTPLLAVGQEAPRCGELIDPDGPWDFGHDDVFPDCIRGPEHPLCNRAAQNQTRTSRVW